MKRILLFFTVLALTAASCRAQETRHEVTVQGSGFFGKSTSGSGIQNEPTNSGGLLAGYRFNINKWVAVEGDYDFFSNSQKYVTSAGNFGTQTYVHGITGTAVFKAAGFSQAQAICRCWWRGARVRSAQYHRDRATDARDLRVRRRR